MTVWVEVDLCSGCKRCVRACPYGAVEMKEGKAQVQDRCTSCGACLQVCKEKALQTDVKPREIPDFSDRKGVWVFAEQREGQLNKVSLELLGKAQELGAALNQSVSALLLGDGVAGLAGTLIEYGAETVYLVEHKGLKDFRTNAYTQGARRTGEKIQAQYPAHGRDPPGPGPGSKSFPSGRSGTHGRLHGAEHRSQRGDSCSRPGRPLGAMSWPPSPTDTRAPRWRPCVLE